eukprot:CAMPEP_0172520674 /NCGR_PEP_ID=MMETSP1066-20121228/292140_1 /TAXON_ID=671091 /ORGANISM="Coscinodiscus wailesii, Strain CCMP2513" /LENGTH=291 /DNA_ID=CAMNT_0013303471 /DNA_START=37 /DNA_END=912 /DNA_ORIENTATION=+
MAESTTVTSYRRDLSQQDNGVENENLAINANSNKRNMIKKIAIAVVLIGFIVYVIIDSLTTQNVKKGIDIFFTWIEINPAAGLFAFMGVYFVATVLFIPGSILTLGGGFVFSNAFGLGLGVLMATVAVFVGASLGATAAFLLGRYLLRDWVQKLTTKYPVFEAIDSALQEKGFRIMALIRLSPLIPFNALNYITGVTAVSFGANTVALVAILPGTILYVFLGASAGSLADSASSGSNSVVRIVSIVVGIVFGILGIAVTSYYAKKELNKVIARRQEETQNDTDEENVNDNE